MRSTTYRFHEAANRIYDFFWGEFCDWYLELIKPRLNFEEGADKDEARIACANLVNLFDASLRLLHPVMPFITEEIWQAIYEGKPPLKSIALAGYPQADEKQFDLAAETEMAILQDLIVNVRNVRAELKVEPKVKVPIEVFAHEAGDSRDDRTESRRCRAPGECGEDYIRRRLAGQTSRCPQHRAFRRSRNLRKKNRRRRRA